STATTNRPSAAVSCGEEAESSTSVPSLLIQCPGRPLTSSTKRERSSAAREASTALWNTTGVAPSGTATIREGSAWSRFQRNNRGGARRAMHNAPFIRYVQSYCYG